MRRLSRLALIATAISIGLAALLAGEAQKISELYSANDIVIPARAPIAAFWQGAISRSTEAHQTRISLTAAAGADLPAHSPSLAKTK